METAGEAGCGSSRIEVERRWSICCVDGLATICEEMYFVAMSFKKDGHSLLYPREIKGWIIEAKALISDHE